MMIYINNKISNDEELPNQSFNLIITKLFLRHNDTELFDIGAL